MTRTISFYLSLYLMGASGLAIAGNSDSPEQPPSEKKQLAPKIPVAKLPPHLSIQVPKAMSLLPGLSGRISTTAGQTSYFGDEKSTTGAIAFGRANRGALYVTWVQSEAAIFQPEKTIRDAFDSLHRAPFDANKNSAIDEVSYRERAFGDLSEMTWEWLHKENDTVNVVRVLAWKDTDSRTHLEIAECIFGQEGSSDFRAECTNALASLTLSKSVSIAKLGALEPPKSPIPSAPEDFAVPELTTGELRVPSSLGAPPSQMGEVLYQGKPKSKPQSTNNRIYIGIGLALLALAIWLTTRDPNAPKSWAKDDPKVDPEASESAKLAGNLIDEDSDEASGQEDSSETGGQEGSSETGGQEDPNETEEIDT